MAHVEPGDAREEQADREASPVLAYVAKLKADRRAELAAREADQRRQELEARDRDREQFRRAMMGAIEAAGAEWLAEFYGGTQPGGTWNKFEILEVNFVVPGHRPIVLRLLKTSAGWESVAHQTSGELSDWMGKAPNGWLSAETLADALIAAEVNAGDDGQVPIPY